MTTPTAELVLGDSFEILAAMPENSIDAVVTDPPYGLEFMGKEWDRFAPAAPKLRAGWDTAGGVHQITTTEEAGDKPTGRVAFHKRRQTFRCPDCGKRDGFRNPHGVCSGEWTTEWIDELPLEAHAFQVWTTEWARLALRVLKPGGHLLAFGGTRVYHRLASGLEDAGFEIRDCLVWGYANGFPKSLDVERAVGVRAGADAGAEWTGYGTALKPAWEPVVMARKLTIGTVAENVLAHRTGALNIDAARLPGEEGAGVWGTSNETVAEDRMFAHSPDRAAFRSERHELGRWPANVMLTDPIDADYSRFFLIPKADRDEREPIIGRTSSRQNTHPTVKPVDLMRHLVRLVAAPGAVVLDPFAGSGTTAIACELEGFASVSIEREPEYFEIMERRLRGTQRGLGLDLPAPAPVRARAPAMPVETSTPAPVEHTPGLFDDQLGPPDMAPMDGSDR